MTLTIQIGNSDDRLAQKQWSEFVNKLISNCQFYGQIHFAGGSPNNTQWQNYCVVLQLTYDNKLDSIMGAMSNLAAEYQQDSIAVTVGQTEFVGPTNISKEEST